MSLAESCVVAAVISTMTLVAVPSLMNARQDYILNGAARQVASHLHSARIKAISRSRDCRLRVTSPAGFVIECEDPSWRLEEEIRLPSGLQISANARPEFHSRGTVAPAATIRVRNDRGREKRVIVNIAGRIRIE